MRKSRLNKELKFIVTLFWLFIIANYVNAQITVTGHVLDTNSKPIEFATVVALSTESNTIITGAITDSNGFFSIKTNNEEKCKIEISFVGFESYSNSISATVDLGGIKLNSNNTIKEVVISSKGRLIERKADRLVFNVENSVSASGGDAIDILRITPRIKVQNDQISMIGKSTMGVMVDDKVILLSGADLVNYLQSIPSDNIKSVEVITTPPAKYDAEGNSGLVNIKMKQPKKDYWGSSLQSFYEQSTYPEGGIRGDINYQKNRLSFTSFLSYTNGSYSPENSSYYFYPSQKWEENTKERSFTDLLSGRFTFKYKLTDKWMFGSQVTAGNNNPNNESNILTKISSNYNTGLDSLIRTSNNTFINSKYVFTNFFSDYQLDSLGKKISVNIDFLDYSIEKDNTFSSRSFLDNQAEISNSFFSQNQLAAQDILNYSAKMDVVLPYDWAELSFGSKISFTQTKDANDFFDLTSGNPVLDNNQSNKFNYDENTFAFYISSRIPFGGKWESQFGVRYENTNTKGISLTLNQSTKVNYSEFFPTVYLSYSANDNNTFSIDYSRRINRPRFSAINPFRSYSNRFSFFEGNPFLKPAFIHNVEFNHVYNKNLSSSLYYSFTDNGSSSITMLNPVTLIRETRPLNYFKLHQVGVSENYTYEELKFLECNIGIDAYWNKTISELPETIPNFEGWGASINLDNTIKVNEALKFSLLLDYSFPSTFIDSKSKSVFTSDIGLNYCFLKNKMQLNALFTDIFRSNKQRFTIVNNEISSSHTYYSDAQRFRISLKYIIGNSKIKSIKQQSGNNEEEGRIK